MNTEEQQKENLVRLAAAHGIQRSYFDIWGNVHETRMEALEQMLVAMGVDLSRPDEVLLQLENHSWIQLAEPVLVESVNQLPTELLFQIPSGKTASKHSNLRFQVQLEIAGEYTDSIKHSYHSEQLAFKEAHQIDDITYERWSLPFPAGLSTGYYRFHITVAYENQNHQKRISRRGHNP